MLDVRGWLSKDHYTMSCGMVFARLCLWYNVVTYTPKDATTGNNAMGKHSFDDGNIQWSQLEGFEHLSYSILNVDRNNMIVDALFRFAAGEKVALHRHVALNHLLVIQGEHILYEPDGSIKETRPCGRYTVSAANEDPHREGGGKEQDVIILFSIRGTDGVMYEILDEENNIVATLGMEDFENLYAAQG